MQIKRFCKRYQIEGPKGLISGKRGTEGNHRHTAGIKQKAVQLNWSKYQDFESTLAQEKLLELDHMILSIGTVRSLMIKKLYLESFSD